MHRAVLHTAVLAAATSALWIAIAAVALHETADAAGADARVEADATTLLTVAEATLDEASLRRAIARTDTGRRGDLAVHLDGTTIGRSRLSDPVAGRPGPRRRVEAADGGSVLLLRAERPGTVVVEAYLAAWRPGPAGARQAGVLVAAVALAAAVWTVLGRRRARFVEAELTALATTARELADGADPVRRAAVTSTGGAEVAAALTALGRHIEEVRAAERRILADLSHRLRTPLTALALDANAIGDGAAADRVRAMIAALDHDVDALIRRVEPLRSGVAWCDVVAVTERRMLFWSPLSQHLGRACDVRLADEPAWVSLRPDDLAAVLDALLGNVFRHTPEGTPWAVGVVRHAGWVTLVVDDAGAGIPDPAAALRRGASGGGSTGLGLDIARDAVEATGGTLHIERSGLGGARLRLRFGERGAAHADPQEPRAWRLWRSHGNVAERCSEHF